MDEASCLILELQRKLSELDHKVWQYRRDMASEFTKYAESVLRGVPNDVSETVSKAIAESLKGYKSLNPEGLTFVESCGIGNGSLENGNPLHHNNRLSTLPRDREEEEDEPPRSPHERENEFRGLFTPNYLPLLDSTAQNERRSNSDPQPSQMLDTQDKESDMEPSPADASTDTASLAPSPEFQRPDTPKRKNTDEWSVASDVSEGHTRRSALRRSSSMSKTSPRRVRFEVAGEEVLPTSSPLPPQSIFAEDTMDANSDDEEGVMEQIEDIDDVPPKRISSSQALRALSRGPLEEDGTKWTTVSAPPDDSAALPVVSRIDNADSDEEEELFMRAKKPTARFKGPTKPLVNSENAKDRELATNSYKSSVDINEPETPTEDDMLDMPPLKSMRGQRSVATTPPLIAPLNINISKPPATSTTPPNKPTLTLEDFDSKQADIGEDFRRLEEPEFFRFDETETNDHQSPPEEEQIESDSDTDSVVSPVTENASSGLSEFSKSPALSIPQMGPIKDNAQSQGIVGSYKGRPFSMPVASEEIQAKAASMGPMNSFVGSLSGRSGFDASDVQSYQRSTGYGSYGSLSRTPRRMSERMMMDESLETEEVTQSNINRR